MDKQIIDLNTFERDTEFYGSVDLLLTVKSFDLGAIRKRYIDSKNNPNNKVGSFKRRDVGEGGVIHVKLENGQLVHQEILTRLKEPRGISFFEDKVAIGAENEVHILSSKGQMTIKNPWFSYIHTVDFNHDGSKILISSSGFDCLFEYDTETGQQLSEWFAWENGLNQSRESIETKTILTRNSEEAKSLELSGNNVVLINDPEKQVLPTAKRAAFINSVFYHPDDNTKVLATLFHEGSVRMIDLTSGQSKVTLDGMESPHGGMIFKGNVMATNTRGGSIDMIQHGVKTSFDFKNLPGKHVEMEGSEWLQNSLHAADSVITIDSNRTSFVLFNHNRKLIDQVSFDDNWAVQDLKKITPNEVLFEQLRNLS